MLRPQVVWSRHSRARPVVADALFLRRTWTLLLTGAALCIAVLFGQIAPAAAHIEMLSDPEDGAQLTSVPAQVVISFDKEIDQTRVQVTRDLAGHRLSVAVEPRVDGREMTVPLDKFKPDLGGLFTVLYRIVNVEGTVLESTVRFAVQLPGEPAVEITTEPAPTLAVIVGPAQTDPTATGPIDSPAPTDDDRVWTYALGGVAVLVAVGAAVAVLRRRRSVP